MLFAMCSATVIDPCVKKHAKEIISEFNIPRSGRLQRTDLKIGMEAHE